MLALEPNIIGLIDSVIVRTLASQVEIKLGSCLTFFASEPLTKGKIPNTDNE